MPACREKGYVAELETRCAAYDGEIEQHKTVQADYVIHSQALQEQLARYKEKLSLRWVLGRCKGNMPLGWVLQREMFGHY